MDTKQKGTAKKKRKLKKGRIIILLCELIVLIGVGVLFAFILKVNQEFPQARSGAQPAVRNGYSQRAFG